MAKTSYVTTHGMVWGEISSGATTSYGHDALGSVTEIFSAGALVNTYRYKPYGAILAKTGTASDPSFLWNGRSGYRGTLLPSASHYVLKRHYSSSTAQWTSADNFWPAEATYGYSRARAQLLSDPSGESPTHTFVSMSCSCGNSDALAGISDTDQSHLGGYVVQQVTITSSLFDCRGNPLVTLPCQTGTPYYELFSIPSNPKQGANDHFAIANVAGCVYGTMAWNAVLWYAGKNKPSVFNGSNSVPCSGKLPSTTSMPVGFAAQGTASATVTFGCCNNKVQRVTIGNGSLVYNEIWWCCYNKYGVQNCTDPGATGSAVSSTSSVTCGSS